MKPDNNRHRNKAVGSSPNMLSRAWNYLRSTTNKAFSVTMSYVSPFMLGQPIFTDWNCENAVEQGFKASHYVFACVSLRAKEASQIPWIVQRKVKGQWVRVLGHPLEKLLEHPNPIQSRIDLIMRTSMFLDLCGNALIYKTMYNDTVVELINIQPDKIYPRPDKAKFIKDYEFRPSSGEYDYIPTKKIIHIQYPDPCNPYWGIGPLQAVGRIVDTEVAAINWQKNSLDNRAVKDGLLTFKRQLTIEQYDKIRGQFAEQIQGASAARGPIILGEDANYLPFSMTAAELDFVNSRKMSREDIAIAFGVPPPLIGILDNANYQNISEARLIFWLDTMIPHMELIAASLNRVLTPEFENPEEFRVTYDLTQVPALYDILDRAATTARKFFEMGVSFDLINARLQLGFPAHIEGGDLGYVPSNLFPLGPDGPIPVESDTERALADAQIEQMSRPPEPPPQADPQADPNQANPGQGDKPPKKDSKPDGKEDP